MLGTSLADAVMLVGTVDVVFGAVDLSSNTTPHAGRAPVAVLLSVGYTVLMV